MAIASPPSGSSSLITSNFVLIDGECPRLFALFEEFFRKAVESVYGPKPDALSSIRSRATLLCEMLMDKETPKGLVVYQTKLSRGSDLELRNFSLLDPLPQEKTTLNLQILEHIKAIARARLARGIVTFTTCREQKEFLELHGFRTENETALSSELREYNLRMTLESASEKDSPPAFKRQCVPHGGDGALPPSRDFVERGAPTGPSASRTGMPARTERCTLRREYVEQIRSGAKTYEGRVGTGMFRSYKEGMQVCWYCSGAEVLTRIVSVRRFSSFEEMVKNVGYKKLLPTASSEEQAIGEYHKIPGYTDKAKQYGTIAFEVEVIKPGSAQELVRKRERSE